MPVDMSHDALFKRLFENPDMVADLLRHVIPRELAEKMDFASLEEFPSVHVGDRREERRNDLVWRLKVSNDWCYLLLMLEFQASEDWWMPVRVLTYTGLLRQHVIRAEKLSRSSRLPPVLPVVLYNGGRPWRPATDVRGLLPEDLEPVEEFQPRQEYLLVDMLHVPDEELGAGTLTNILIRLQKAADFQAVLAAITDLCGILAPGQAEELHKAFIAFLKINVFKRAKVSENIASCTTIQEARNMLCDVLPRWEEEILARGLQQGREQGLQQGREQGLQQGEIRALRQMLRDILAYRFGELPPDLSAGLDVLDTQPVLSALARHAYTADSLAMFRQAMRELLQDGAGGQS